MSDENQAETIVLCDICLRYFDANSESIRYIDVDKYRCKSCDTSPYPEDWFDDEEDDDYIVETCLVCGGEVAEDYSSCDCEDGPTLHVFGPDG